METARHRTNTIKSLIKMAYNGQGREEKEETDSSPIMCFMQISPPSFFIQKLL